MYTSTKKIKNLILVLAKFNLIQKYGQSRGFRGFGTGNAIHGVLSYLINFHVS